MKKIMNTLAALVLALSLGVPVVGAMAAPPQPPKARAMKSHKAKKSKAAHKTTQSSTKQSK